MSASNGKAFEGEEPPELGPGDPTVTLAQFIARKPEDVAALVSCAEGPVLPRAGLTLLVSKSGAGKTTIVADLALHAAAGIEWCGLTFPRPLRVLMIENEGPREAFRQKVELRVSSWTGTEEAEPVRIWDDPARWGGVRLSNDEQLAQLRHVVERHRIDLCISDTLSRFGMRGNGTPEETGEFVDLMTAAGLNEDLAFLLLHHPVTRHDPGLDELERITGAWPPHADAILYLQKLVGNRARLSFPKLRWARGQRPASILAFDPEAEAFTYVADDGSKAEDDDRDYLAEITEALSNGEWWSVYGLRRSRDKGGIGARDDRIEATLADASFESAQGEAIGKRRDTTYFRLRNLHADLHHDLHGPLVEVVEVPIPGIEGETTSTSTHHPVGVGGGGVRGDAAPLQSPSFEGEEPA